MADDAVHWCCKECRTCNFHVGPCRICRAPQPAAGSPEGSSLSAPAISDDAPAPPENDDYRAAS